MNNKLFVTIGVAAVAVACRAGIKYWDNPAYEAKTANGKTVRLTWRAFPPDLRFIFQ